MSISLSSILTTKIEFENRKMKVKLEDAVGMTFEGWQYLPWIFQTATQSSSFDDQTTVLMPFIITVDLCNIASMITKLKSDFFFLFFFLSLFRLRAFFDNVYDLMARDMHESKAYLLSILSNQRSYLCRLLGMEVGAFSKCFSFILQN